MRAEEEEMRAIERRGGEALFTILRFNLRYTTREWRLMKHDNGGVFIAISLWWLTGF